MDNIPNYKLKKRDQDKYIFVKEYPTYILFKNKLNGCFECIHKQELGLFPEKVKPTYENANRYSKPSAEELERVEE